MRNSEQRKIEVDNIDLHRLKEKTAENPGLLPYAHSVGGITVKPEDTGKIKGRAIAAMEQQTDRQMTQLYEQMETLAKQAKELQRRVEISNQIYNAQMGFEPLIGHTYYLYLKKDGTHTLSMVKPEEWGKSLPFQRFEAEVTLLADHTWDVIFAEDHG